ncbi:MAG: type 2 isopentenyl-diphosphate Delta-isomerase [Chloroflexota bacterium]
MPKVTQTSSRKNDHIIINLEENVSSSLTTGLEELHFVHEALPEIDLEDVDLSVEVFGKTLHAPQLISSMTGGTPDAQRLNLILAEAAQETGIAMGVGSQRAAIEDKTLVKTFQVRSVAPDISLFANLGAVQLNYGYTVEECRKAVDMIEADALILHFNALQEAVQPEGDTRFSGLLPKISHVCKKLAVPVIAKEVGWGFSRNTAKRLIEAGISAIDVAGAGGTSWSQVEMHRAQTDSQRRLAGAFLNWGIPTADSIKQIREVSKDILIFASGGIRTGIDVAKSIALGATLGGMAGPYLMSANKSLQKTIETILDTKREIQVAMFAAGISSIKTLQKAELVEYN